MMPQYCRHVSWVSYILWQGTIATYKERLSGFGGVCGCSLVTRLEVGRGVGDRMHDGLHRGHPGSPSMQRHECRLTPARQGNQEVVPAGKRNGDAHVDETESARSVADILACLELRGHEPDVGRESPEGDRREDYVQDDVHGDEDAECSPWQVADLAGKRLELSGSEQSGEKDGVLQLGPQGPGGLGRLGDDHAGQLGVEATDDDGADDEEVKSQPVGHELSIRGFMLKGDIGKHTNTWCAGTRISQTRPACRGWHCRRHGLPGSSR